MRRIALSVLILLFYLPTVSGQAAEAKVLAPKILVIGDSLSAAFGIERKQGWVHLLQSHLNRNGHKYRVINASVSGETSRGGLARLPMSLKQHQPQIVIIALGGNDGLRGISPKEFRKNLDSMITKAKSAKAKVLLCGVRIPPNLGMVYVAKFLQVYAETAQKHKIPFIQYMLKNVADKSNLMQQDGIHPTAEAQPIILQNVLSQLNTII